MSSPNPNESAPDRSNQTFDMNARPVYAPARRQRRRYGCCCGCALGCFGLILLAGIGIAVLVYFFVSGSVPLVPSPETTVITEPVKSDGKTIDYHKAIQDILQADTLPDENGFRDVLLAFGQQVLTADKSGNDQSGDTEQSYRILCEAVKIDPQTPPAHPFPQKQSDTLDTWIENITPGLNAVQLAAAKPDYYIPWIRKDEKEWAFLAHPREVYTFHEQLIEAFRMRAFIRLDSEDEDAVDKARQDILALLRLTRQAGIYEVWLSTTAASNSETIKNDVQKIAASLSRWTPDQLEQTIKDLETLPNWQNRETTLKIVQFLTLDIIATLGTPNGFNSLPQPSHPKFQELAGILQSLNIISFDWNVAAENFNTGLDEHRKQLAEADRKNLDDQFEILQLRKTSEKNPHLEKNMHFQVMLQERFEAEGIPNILTASGRSKLAGMALGNLLVPMVLSDLYRLQLQEESRCQTLRYVLALEQYYREKEQYPESLNELGLKPLEPGMNIQYEKRNAGYRLYNQMFVFEKD